MKHAIITVLAIVAILATTASMWVPKAIHILPDDTFTGVYPGTTDTGESSPIWSVRFMEHYPQVPIEVINGKADIEVVFRNTTRHEYRVSAVERSRLVENTLYFLGWQVMIDGAMTLIEFQDPSHRGLMTFWVDPGEHVVTVIFRETKLRSYANAISLVSVGILIFGSTILIRRKSV
jgi:hypothetical protein